MEIGDKFQYIIINKNRGWRGLAEATVEDDSHESQMKMVFSFSPAVWEDLMLGRIVMQDAYNYYVITIEEREGLPKPNQQRSVLIKNFKSKIKTVHVYPKVVAITSIDNIDDKYSIVHSRKNQNNHTKSEWNYIGIRVVPEI